MKARPADCVRRLVFQDEERRRFTIDPGLKSADAPQVTAEIVRVTTAGEESSGCILIFSRQL